MEYRAVTDKLLDLCEQRAEEIAVRWFKAVVGNPKTPSYCFFPREKCLRQAVSLYKNLKPMFFAENAYQAVLQFLERASYVEDVHAAGIPLAEAIYALILLRRQIWLYADIQALFNTPLDMYQATESINRTLLLFDYAIYIVTSKYQELTRR